MQWKSLYYTIILKEKSCTISKILKSFLQFKADMAEFNK